jgi:hypothetical protein
VCPAGYVQSTTADAVQIRARNTSGSIQAVTARHIISVRRHPFSPPYALISSSKELRRAHELLVAGAAFANLCAPPEKPVAGVRPRRAIRILSPEQQAADLASMQARARQSDASTSAPLTTTRRRGKGKREEKLKAEAPAAAGRSTVNAQAISGAVPEPSAVHSVPSHVPSGFPATIHPEPSSEHALVLRRQCYMTVRTKPASSPQAHVDADRAFRSRASRA